MTYSCFSSRMCIEAQNTARICLICHDSTTYSYFSSRMCIDGYWSPSHRDDLLNPSQYGPQHRNVWADSSRSVKKTATSPTPRTHRTATQAPPHPGATSPPRECPGPTTLPRTRHLTQAPHHRHASAKGPSHCHAGATSPRRHPTATQAFRAHPTATQAPPHPRHEFLIKKGKLGAQGTRTPDITLQPEHFYH
jgi:hypothetical protein